MANAVKDAHREKIEILDQLKIYNEAFRATPHRAERFFLQHARQAPACKKRCHAQAVSRSHRR